MARCWRLPSRWRRSQRAVRSRQAPRRNTHAHCHARATATRTAGSSDCHKNAPPILHDGFPEPPARYSRNGVLDVTLRASLGKVPIDGRRVTALNYDGSFPGPTLVICAGRPA